MEQSGLPEQFTKTVTEWQERLLQLDRRNGRLYLKPESRSLVPIEQMSADGITDMLDSKGTRGVSFDYAEPRGRDEPYVVKGDLRGDFPPIELQRRLGNLRKRQREWQEEQGLSVLYLALGLLHWIDEDDEPAIAPLLLLPCDLTKAGPRSEFRLASTDDDFEPNETLNVKFSKDLGINLPAAKPDMKPSEYFELVCKAIARRTDWQVEDKVCLGIFSYSKLPMWRDLEHLKEYGTDNRVVSVLSGLSDNRHSQLPPSAIPANPAELVGGKLDDLLDLKDQHTVLPADYSQLISITHAKDGDNLVVHGPPGTGKSQTIANMISTFMAEGKSVLFVSEKTAALDVVKKRLDDAELGTFCLDLHSERGRKANVYAQLGESVNLVQPATRASRLLQRLHNQRETLNAIVRQLHHIQSPLGMSIYQAQSLYASLRKAPPLRLKLPVGIMSIDQDWLTRMRDLLARISQRPAEYEQHETNPWRILKTDTPSLRLAESIREDMASIANAVESIKARLYNSAVFLGVKQPEILEEGDTLNRLLAHLSRAPGVLANWLSAAQLSDLVLRCETESRGQREREESIGILEQAWGFVPDWDFLAIREHIELSSAERTQLEHSLGESWGNLLVEKAPLMLSGVKEVIRLAKETQSAFDDLKTILALPIECSRSSIRDYLETTDTIASLVPVPVAWISGRIEDTRSVLHLAKGEQEALSEAEQDLFADYERQILDVVDRAMLIRYRTEHHSVLQRVFSNSFRRDQNILRAHQVQPRKLTLSEGAFLVQEVIELSDMRKAWSDQSEQRERMFGSRYQDRATDWDSIEQDLAKTDILAHKSGSIRSLLVEEANPGQLGNAEKLLREKARDLDKVLRSVVDDEMYAEYSDGHIPIGQLTQSFAAIVPLLERITPDLEHLVQAAQTPPVSVDRIIEWGKTGARLQAIESDARLRETSLRAQFGDKHRGFDTDWMQVQADLAWTREFLQIAPVHINDSLTKHAISPLSSHVYSEHADRVLAAEREFRNIESDFTDYDLSAGPWPSWSATPFDTTRASIADLHGDADKASDWVLYRNTVAEAERILGPNAIGDCRRLIGDASIVPNMVERSVIGEWLDNICGKTPLLRDFSSTDHDALRTQFRELDERFPLAVRSNTQQRMRERYAPIKQSWGMSILKRELSKRRRQKSVRALFNAIPDCIQDLKPCFLMSPLAVSQYLSIEEADEQDTDENIKQPKQLAFGSGKLTFDAVIFNEASQIFPEDAIPALLHGKQAILAGDLKQLPPSHFWRRSVDDDDDYDDDSDDSSSDADDPNALKSRESILDVAVQFLGSLFRDSNLDMHYRSRHEDLIRFSNHHFYGGRLLTFPSPGVRDDWQGIHRHFLPDALYDSGGARTNPGEAKQVVDLVFEHIRTHPDKSLGVAALSRAQADLIERLIQERRLIERDIDQGFSDVRLEPFFVKNLENVQGDERDRIIISSGYGPTTKGGPTPNRFGPINAVGGQRRLNVLVTRARERMDIVHSIDPAHITSQSVGAQLLRLFLEYAANPAMHLGDGPSTPLAQPTGEELNDFEKAVMDALQARGHQVVSQVGSAGYRIDLAVLSEDGARYDLGVECDGATYHSSPAARDRDWLRQSVLEGLGWTIHRVWSTSWARNPAAEIERIEEALIRARRQAPIRSQTPEPTGTAGPTISNSVPNAAEDAPTESIIDFQPLTLVPYQKADLAQFKPAGELRFASTKSLIEMVMAVAQVEGPVHEDVVVERIHQRYGVWMRKPTKRYVSHALLLASQDYGLLRADDFIYADSNQLNRKPRMLADSNIEHAPPSELKRLIIQVTDGFRGPKEGLLTEVTRALGFTRNGQRIVQHINDMIEDLLREGLLEEIHGIIRLPRP